MAFNIDCNGASQLDAVPSAPNFCGRVLVNQLALFLFKQLNLATATLDTTTEEVTLLPMSTGTMIPVKFDRELATLAWQKTAETEYYTVTLLIPLSGLSAEVRKAVKKITANCGLAAYVGDNKCNEYALGLDWDTTANAGAGGFSQEYTKNSGGMTDHSVSIGGGNDPSNNITIVWKQCEEPYFGTIGFENLPF